MSNERMAAWFPHVEPGASIERQHLDSMIGDAARRWSFQMDLAALEQAINELRTEVHELRAELSVFRTASGAPIPAEFPPPTAIDGA